MLLFGVVCLGIFLKTSAGILNAETVNTPFTGNEENICPTEWSRFKNHCYYNFHFEKPFNDAEAICQSYGSHLVSIHSQAEADYIFRKYFLKSSKNWII